MNKKKKPIISPCSFPNYLAPDEEKIKEEYGRKMAKAIEYEWFYRPESGSCTYYDKRDKYHKLRLYGRGEQSTKLYKDLLNGGEDASYANYDWRPIQVIPKFVKLIVNQMTERLFDVKAEAVDNYSTDLKDKHKKNLEKFVIAKPAMQEIKNAMGVDLFPPESSEYPESKEEVDLFMQLKYKPAIEIACEEAIKYTLDLNDYHETQSKVIEDICTIGLGAVKHTTDPIKGIMVKWIDPANMVNSYPIHRTFKKVHYYGEQERITINELKRLSGNKFTDEELTEIANSTSEWSRYHGNTNDQYQNRSDDLEGMMVDILHFTFKSTNTLSYKKKYNKNGGFKMIRKESTFDKKNKDYTGYDVSKNTIDVWYEGTLILGTDKIFNYGLCQNMIREKGHLHRTMANYIVYAPELYQNRTRSLVERIIPYVDQMQQIHIKMQQLIAKARPNGIYIDVDGLNEIPNGDGGFLSPSEVIKMYDETGNVLGTSKTDEGEYNHGREPIRELKNGVVDGLDRMIMTYNHYLTLIRDAIGMPQGADASTPDPKMAVGVQQQLAMNRNTATRHILEGSLNITERLGKGLSLRIKDIFKYSNIKSAYINAIGKINVEVLKALKNYHLHDLGILIELKPDSEERQFLENNISQALQQQSITLDDAIDIRKIGNIKLANEVLKTRRIKRDKDKRQHEKDLEKIRSEAQSQSQQIAAQAKQMEIQAKSQADMGLVQAKTQSKIAEIEAEKIAKSELMQQEFNYNQMLRGMEVEASLSKENFKEDRKDRRQDRNNSQASQLIQQRNYNEPAKTFESSEDNISGSIEMGELDPS